MTNAYLKATHKLMLWLDKLTDDQVSAIAAGTLKPQLTDAVKKVATAQSYETLVQATAEKIKAMTTREAVRELLADKVYKKDNLLALAKHYDISVQKSDTKAKLIDKLVEGTVGATLRYGALFQG